MKWHPGGGRGGVSWGSVMQVHFKWSIKSSRDTVLLPSLKTMFKKSKSKSPLRDPVVVHNSRHLCGKECARSHFTINKLLERKPQIITLFNSSLTFYSWLIIKQHSIDVTRQRRWMTLSRLDGLNPGKLIGSTDWQLMFSPDATAIIAKMTLNAPSSQ